MRTALFKSSPALVVFVLALTVRLAYLAESYDNPTFLTPIVDAEGYDELARNWAERGIAGDDFFWQPFFYPALLSAIYKLTGSSILAAKIIQAIIGSLTCVLVFRLGLMLFNRRVGWVAAVLDALYGPLIFYELELVGAGWAAFWSVALLLLFLRAERDMRAHTWLILGVGGALSMLTRVEFIPGFAATAIWLLPRAARRAAGWRRVTLLAAMVAAGLAIILIPVSALNKKITGHFGILPYEGGNNIYLGWHPDPCRVLTIRPGPDWEKFISLPAEHGVFGHYAQSDYFIREAARLAVANPRATIRNTGRKLVQLFCSREIPRNEDLYVFREDSWLLSTLAWKAGPFGFPFGVLLPFAVAGLLWHRRQWPPPLLLFLFFYAAAMVLVFVSGRYRIPMIPLLVLPAAAGLCSLPGRFRAWPFRTRAAIGAAGLGLVALSTLPGPFCEEGVNYRAELHAHLGTAWQHGGKNEQAAAAYFKSLEFNPDDSYVLNSLGSVLMDLGRPAEALPHLIRSRDLKAGFAPIEYNLGLAYRQLQQPGQAAAHLSEAAHLRPGDASTWLNLGLARIDLGELTNAVQAFTQAAALDPALPGAQFNLGLALAQIGQDDPAILHLRETLAQDRNDFMAHAALADRLYRKNEMDGALFHFRAAVEIKPDWADGWNNAAWILLNHRKELPGAAAEALRAATRACELTGDQSANFLETLALAQKENGLASEAIATAQKALELARRDNHSELVERLETNFLQAE